MQKCNYLLVLKIDCFVLCKAMQKCQQQQQYQVPTSNPTNSNNDAGVENWNFAWNAANREGSDRSLIYYDIQSRLNGTTVRGLPRDST
jgi:hypothetical protein